MILTELRDWSQKLKVALQDVPEVTDVDTDLQPGGLETDLIVDRDAASRLGLNESIIDSSLGDSFTQALTSTIYDPYNPQQYHVVLEVAPAVLAEPGSAEGHVPEHLRRVRSPAPRPPRPSPAPLPSKEVTKTASSVAQDAARNLASNSLANAGRGNTSTGAAISLSAEQVVPFSAFSHYVTSTTPTSVNHTGTSISTSFSYNLADGRGAEHRGWRRSSRRWPASTCPSASTAAPTARRSCSSSRPATSR